GHEIGVLEHVARAVAQVVAGDQAAIAVRQDVHRQVGVVVVAADLVDQCVQLPHRLQVLLAPVVQQHVVAAPVARAGHRDTRSGAAEAADLLQGIDRKSTRLNSSHVKISYAVFCLKKKKKMSVNQI